MTTSFSFIQVTDLHLSLGDTAYGPGAGDATTWFDGTGVHERVVTTPAVLDALFVELAERHPGAFVVATGDLTNNGTDDELAALASALERSPVPVRALPGNHDHNSAEADHLAGRPLPWERHIGPRWFSFDHGGVHFAAIDWYTHLLGIDTAEQDAWLAADLEALPPDTPVVLLTHDQMSSAFYRALPRKPVASFSGHWHTSRVVEVDGVRHYNTGTAAFGGLDYSPAHYRVCTWDGGRLDVTTVARGPASLGSSTFRAAPGAPVTPAVRWAARLAGGAHLAGPVINGDTVLAVAKDEDRPGGAVSAFDAASGEPRWTVALDSAVKAAPVVVGTTAVAIAVSGEMVGVDVAKGTERWRTRLDDPLLLWAYMRPGVHDGRIFAGDVARFACVDASSGEVVWSRTDLGQRENLTTVTRPAVAGGVLLVGFVGQVPPLWALDPATGATRWPGSVEPGSMYRRPPAELASHLTQVIVGGITPDPDGQDAYVVRLGARVQRIRAADGAVVWSAPNTGWFNPAAPVVHGDAVVTVSSMGEVRSLDRATGAERWCTALPHAAPVAMGAYRADGPVMLAPVTPWGERLLVPRGDGRIVALDAASGALGGSVDAGAPIAAPVAAAGELCIAAAVDGVLRAFPLDAFG